MPPAWKMKAALKHPKPHTDKADEPSSKLSPYAPGVTGEHLVNIVYEIVVMEGGGESSGSNFNYGHQVKAKDMVSAQAEGTVINSLVAAHERTVFESQSWICCGTDCGKPALSFCSYHISNLRGTPASARTIAFPVHEQGSECHIEAQAIWEHTQTTLQSQAGIETEEVDTEGNAVLENGPVMTYPLQTDMSTID